MKALAQRKTYKSEFLLSGGETRRQEQQPSLLQHHEGKEADYSVKALASRKV